MADTFDPIATSLVIAIVLLVIAVIAIFVFASKTAQARRTALAGQDSINKLQEEVHALQVNVQTKAQELYQSWVQRDCESIRTSEREVAQKEAVTLLEQWKYQSEVSIRSDAIQRSHSVIMGKVTEHLVPYMPDFSFNPSDVRFVGSPIDLIVFDGMDEDNLRQVVFIEVKTGASAALTKRERRIRDVISAGQVKWMEMRVQREAPLEASVNPLLERVQPPLEGQQQEPTVTKQDQGTVGEFNDTVIKAIRENAAVGELLFAKLSSFVPARGTGEKLKQEAILAWRQGAREDALRILRQLIGFEITSVPFIKDILTLKE